MSVVAVAVDGGATDAEKEAIQKTLHNHGVEVPLDTYGRKGESVNLAQIIISVAATGTAGAILTSLTNKGWETAASLFSSLRNDRTNDSTNIMIIDADNIHIVIPVPVTDDALRSLDKIDRVAAAGESGTLVWNPHSVRWESPWPGDGEV